MFRAKVNYALARSMEQQREQQLPHGSRARCSATGSCGAVNGRPLIAKGDAEIEAHTPSPLNGVQLAGARKARQIAATTTPLKTEGAFLLTRHGPPANACLLMATSDVCRVCRRTNP